MEIILGKRIHAVLSQHAIKVQLQKRLNNMSTDLPSITSRFHELSGRIKSLQADFDAKEDKIDKTNLLIDDLTQAQWLLTEAQKLTQERFKEKIESLVTMAIKSVYDRPFGFELIFERKRDKMECRPVIYEIVGGEKEYYDDAENELGGGIVDICSFALRIVLFTLEKPRSRNVFILDEPGKNLGQLITLFGQMLREVSHELGLQLIIITHEDALIEISDRSWSVDHDGRESHVTLLEAEQQVKIDVQPVNQISKENKKKRKSPEVKVEITPTPVRRRRQ
jgi:DNA repair exonuclease SbcCD ATPase subunit